MLRAFGHRVETCCDMLGVGVVGSSLKMVKFEPTTPNMSQHGGQTRATCCAQQCCDMLRCLDAIVWRGLRFNDLRTVPTKCKSFCSRLRPRAKSTSLQVLLEFTKKN